MSQPTPPPCVFPADEAVCIHDYPRYVLWPDGRVWNSRKMAFASPCLSKSGYPRVNLSRGSRDTYQQTTACIHRLLGLYYLPNPDKHPCVDHLDQDKTNNTLSNLRWASVSENQQNKSVQKNSKSGLLGVCWSKGHQRWRASIYINKKQKHWHFVDKMEAVRHRAKMEVLHYNTRPILAA